MSETNQPSAEKIADILSAYHEQLVVHESPEVDTTALNAEELVQFRRLKDCLVQLELLRTLEGTIEAVGEANSRLVAGSQPDDRWGAGQGRIGRFEIVRELGRGGFGVVFLAHDDLLDRLVALKVPRPEVLITSEVRERFDREAQAAARLTHPHLVPVHEVGQIGPIIYIVSAYCPGPNLRQWLDKHGSSLSPRQAAQLVASLAEAVHYAHGQGVLHRDIKPSNVLLEVPSGDTEVAAQSFDGNELPFVPKLVDFGLARLMDATTSHTHSGVALGTFGYMAPEQAEGRLQDVGPATDVHALGAVLYECLTGQAPYSGESVADCLRRIVCDEPQRPRNIERQIPRDLEAICLKCLEKLPARRYAAAGDLAADLRRFLAGESTKARPLGPIDRAWHWTCRRPATAALTAVSLLAGLTIVIGSVFYSVRIDRTLAVSEQRRVEADEMRGQAEANAQLARNHAARLHQHAYVADMRVAQQLRHDGDLASLMPLLDRHSAPATNSDDDGVFSGPRGGDVTDRRSADTEVIGKMPFEWRYLNRLRNVIRLKLEAHSGDVDYLGFSALGDVLATSSVKDGFVRLWEIPSGRPLGAFVVRTKPMRRWEEDIAALSPDGRRVAGLVNVNSIAVWDVASHAEVARLSQQRPIHTVAFLSDSVRVVGGGDDQTLVWDCETGDVVASYPGARLVAVCSGDRQLGLVDTPPVANTVRLCDLPLSPAKREFPQAGPVRQIVYAPDGCSVASLSDSRVWCDIRVFHPRNSALLGIGFGSRGEWYGQIGFSADSRWLVATAMDGSLKFYHPQTAQPLGTLRGPAARLTHFAFSADNRWLATAVPNGGVILWDKPLLDTCDELSPANEVVAPLVFSPDGKTLAVATPSRSALLIDAATGRVDARLPEHLDLICDLAFSADGTQLATTDGDRVYCWNWRDGKQLWATPVAFAKCVAWSSRHGLIAWAGANRQIQLLKADNGEVVPAGFAHDDIITGLRFLPGTDQLVSVSLDATIRTWDIVEKRAVGKPFSTDGPIDQMTLSADGKILACGYRTGVFNLWKRNGDASLENLLTNGFWEPGHASALALSADGQTLGIGGYGSNFRAINLKTKQPAFTISGRRVGGTSIAYSPDGHTLASISREGCLTLWNLDKWQMRTLDGSPLSPVRSLAFSKDGSALAIATDDSVALDRPGPAAKEDSPTVRVTASLAGALRFATGHPLGTDGRPWDVGGPGIRIWDIAGGSESPMLSECITPAAVPLVAWSPSGILAAGSRDGTAWIWNPELGQLVARFPVSSSSNEALSWQPKSGGGPVDRHLLERLDPVSALAFSIDGERFAVATRRGTIQLVNANDWAHRITLSTDAAEVGCLAFSPTGSKLVANSGGRLVCWRLEDVAKSSAPQMIGDAGEPAISSMAFTHDGRMLALGRVDGSVQQYDAATLDHLHTLGQVPVQTLKGHLDRVTSLSFSTDDRTLATGSWDTTVRLWNVASGQEVGVLTAHHGKIEAVAFSPSGGVLATGGQKDADRGEIFLWYATP